MKANIILVVVVVVHLSQRFELALGFCDKFPFGTTCRPMDLTGFCLQVSNLLRIQETEPRSPPYTQFDKIFLKLKNDVLASKPFLHFGAYKRGNIWPCVDKKCTPMMEGTTTPASAGEKKTTTPGPAGPPPCPPGIPPPPIPCPDGTHKNGPQDTDDITKPDYEGCEKDCNCCIVPLKEDVAEGTIFSIQDGCELKYLKAPIAPVEGGTVLNPIKKGADAKVNPYRLEITEITVKNAVLHNWLHIRIYSEGTAELNSKDLGEGKIKMAFIIAHDALGFPVGEFVNNIPCGNQCNCTEANEDCHQGTYDDTIPCMFDGPRVTMNTGMMMVYSKLDGEKEGMTEIHGSWRYTQSASPEHFTTELHFRALVVDEFSYFIMKAEDSENIRIGGISERRMDKKGMFGWNPVYNILHPTIESLGAYDYFREDVYLPEDINCHVPLQPSHYTVEPYPDSGPQIQQISVEPGSEREHCYRLNNTFRESKPFDIINYCFADGNGKNKRTPIRCPGIRSKVEPWFHDTYGFTWDGQVDRKQVYPWTIFGARTEAYVVRDGGLDRDNWRTFPDYTSIATKLYWGIETKEIANSMEYAECETGDESKYYGMAQQPAYPGPLQNYDIQGKYGHFCTSDGAGRRVLNLPPPIDKWPNTLAQLWKFPPVTAQSFLEDRCYCARIPPTPDPRYREPPEVQVQGRRQHAYQMILAWNCMVPFGIFVSRYYKETYSKVFFLQEYWWFTIHVLCMWSAAMFTFGGVYVMELKRRHSINWLDPNITVHIVIGYLIISVFFVQVISGFFRVREPKKRPFQIFTHWLLGVLEYLLAVVCMLNASFILLSGMTCEGVVALVFLLLIQSMFYASMEVHMRNVDKQLKLKPPRSYLPPPIMRVFHVDAPFSKFRVHVLIAYCGLCVATSLIQFTAMESNKLGESCFIKSKRYVDPTEIVEEED